jgi:uncharacterized membrane protein
MTEDQIERLVETTMDNLERRYLAGEMTEAEYGYRVRALDLWAADEIARVAA